MKNFIYLYNETIEQKINKLVDNFPDNFIFHVEFFIPGLQIIPLG